MDKNNENHMFSLSFLNCLSLTFLYYTRLDHNDIIHILERNGEKWWKIDEEQAIFSNL